MNNFLRSLIKSRFFKMACIILCLVAIGLIMVWARAFYGSMQAYQRGETFLEEKLKAFRGMNDAELESVNRAGLPELYQTALLQAKLLRAWCLFHRLKVSPRVERVKRLYELRDLEDIVKVIPTLQLESTEYFTYERKATLEWLTTQATHHHYSTFYLYNEIEFKEALNKFQEDIAQHFKNPDNIIWNDENIMLNMRKRVR